jgi:hypothetical protein
MLSRPHASSGLQRLTLRGRPTSRTGRLWSAQLKLTTNPDHNRIRHEPILADYLKAQAQVSDGIRQPARICKQGVTAGRHGKATGAILPRHCVRWTVGGECGHCVSISAFDSPTD